MTADLQNKTIVLNKRRFYTGLVGAVLITLGIILSENAIEKKNNAAVGLILFVVGWAVFFSTQCHDLLWLRGIGVPIMAVIGQVYLMYVLEQSNSKRRQLLWATAMVWMAFAALWFYYAYRMTLVPGTERISTQRAVNVWTGLALLVVGMKGYFFVRENSWNKLTGGVIPNMPMGMGMFNVFVPLIGIGWVLISLGNSVDDQQDEFDDDESTYSDSEE